MRVNGQHHTPAARNLEKMPPPPLPGYIFKILSEPQSQSQIFREEKNSYRFRESKPATQPVVRDYINLYLSLEQ
jgi:hypothetical protein